MKQSYVHSTVFHCWEEDQDKRSCKVNPASDLTRARFFVESDGKSLAEDILITIGGQEGKVIVNEQPDPAIIFVN